MYGLLVACADDAKEVGNPSEKISAPRCAGHNALVGERPGDDLARMGRVLLQKGSRPRNADACPG